MAVRCSKVLRLVVFATVLAVGSGMWGSWALGQECDVTNPTTFAACAEYKCRVEAPGRAERTAVSLQDQFDRLLTPAATEEVTVMQPLYVCSQATKNGVTPTVLLPDLKCFVIVPSGPPILATADLTTQFGTEHHALITASAMLCTQVKKENESLVHQ